MAAKLKFLGFAVAAMLSISPILSADDDENCAARTFQNKMVYANCTVLPVLDAVLRWTYTARNSTLSIAFTAKAESETWIAFGVNLNGSGMVGAESLIASKPNTSAPATVKPYRLFSYTNISQEELSFPVTGLAAEDSSSGEDMTLFATLALPRNDTAAPSVNHVWQVGKALNGIPQRHDLDAQENLKAKGTLELVKSTGAAQINSTTGGASGGGGGNGTTTPSSGGEKKIGVSLGIVVLVIGNFLGFY